MSFEPETPPAASLAPGADEVSASIAALFDSYARTYQALQNQFLQLLNGDGEGADDGLHG